MYSTENSILQVHDEQSEVQDVQNYKYIYMYSCYISTPESRVSTSNLIPGNTRENEQQLSNN